MEKIGIDELKNVIGGSDCTVEIDGVKYELDFTDGPLNSDVEVGLNIEDATTNPHSKRYKGGLSKKK